MLEILIIWQLAKSIGKTAAAKGRSSGAYKALLVLCWIGGEIVGAILAVLAGAAGGALYLGAIVGAIVGAISAFAIAKSVSPLTAEARTGGFPVLPVSYANPIAQREDPLP
jgi:hypothetical protein